MRKTDFRIRRDNTKLRSKGDFGRFRNQYEQRRKRETRSKFIILAIGIVLLTLLVLYYTHAAHLPATGSLNELKIENVQQKL
ncbi:MAG: hypothetical protein RIC80_17140 [Cyclobacteriaceae bacterium]